MIFIRQLLEKDLADAVSLVDSQWGGKYARHFEQEFALPYVKCFGAFNESNLCGITAICKSIMDFDYWGITWVLVSPEYRNQGVGGHLVTRAEKEIAFDSVNYPSDKVIVELTARIPEYYKSMGYSVVSSFDNGSHLMLKVLFEGAKCSG